MRKVELMLALRDFTEARDRLKKAEERMGGIISWGRRIKSDFVPMFGYRTDFIIETISELKKAHYAYQELFRDHEMERDLLLIKMMHEAIAARAAFRLLSEQD